ncbi:cysteine peptidase family C39 domain-containing protein [Candidatus Uabimicrobium sp. HlEnr_7]|uniref:cysteine peptidase family C39 domain-containing protein n=1 Tax=Candidatus Uabimicrobium helgolandensis TaxID=3095367 RepID=UPI0035581CFD
MKIVVFFMLIVVSFAFYFIGVFLAKKDKKLVLFLAIISLCLCFLFEGLRIYRVWLPLLLPLDIAIYLEKGAFVPFAVFFFAICTRSIDSKFTVKALHAMCFLLIGYQVIYSSWMVMPVIKCGTFKMVDGVCMQSTPSTCGPACLVTVLRSNGLDTDEQQMTDLSHTTTLWGTTSLRILKGISDFASMQKIKCSASVRYTTWSELATIKKPCIVDTKYSSYVNHVMVLFGMTKNEQVIIGDPLQGKIYMSKHKFMEIWTKEVIIFE